MNDLLLDIIEHLVSQDLVVGDGTDSFRDFTPETPDNVFVVHEYPGSPLPFQDTFTHRSLQLTVRDKSASRAKTQCIKIFNELSPVDRYKTLSNGRWCQIYPRQLPFKIKVDNAGRTTYGFNIGITTERD